MDQGNIRPFIMAHHATELWDNLVMHELRSAMSLMALDSPGPALERRASTTNSCCSWRAATTRSPAELTDGDWRRRHTQNEDLVDVLADVYTPPENQWDVDVDETCEELIDVEDTFQAWRFRHLKTVQRVIGREKGTGGSSGVSFLRRALDLTFFPELSAVRIEIGR